MCSSLFYLLEKVAIFCHRNLVVNKISNFHIFVYLCTKKTCLCGFDSYLAYVAKILKAIEWSSTISKLCTENYCK